MYLSSESSWTWSQHSPSSCLLLLLRSLNFLSLVMRRILTDISIFVYNNCTYTFILLQATGICLMCVTFIILPLSIWQTPPLVSRLILKVLLWKRFYTLWKAVLSLFSALGLCNPSVTGWVTVAFYLPLPLVEDMQASLSLFFSD